MECGDEPKLHRSTAPVVVKPTVGRRKPIARTNANNGWTTVTPKIPKSTGRNSINRATIHNHDTTRGQPSKKFPSEPNNLQAIDMLETAGIPEIRFKIDSTVYAFNTSVLCKCNSNLRTTNMYSILLSAIEEISKNRDQY